ncbi:hypothetical protein Pelo_19264 [Pelomyxa schiedti]|nr:hypothetical protein Pelo_19264 [Pelomyxa schiedti]
MQLCELMSFLGTSVQSVLEMKNALLSCRADMQHWKLVLELQQSLLCFRFAFQSSCTIPGASKRCENTFENSADSSSVRNSPKRECLSAEMVGCHGVNLSTELSYCHASASFAANCNGGQNRDAWRSQLSNRLP